MVSDPIYGASNHIIHTPSQIVLGVRRCIGKDPTLKSDISVVSSYNDFCHKTLTVISVGYHERLLARSLEGDLH
jgi:hypothetical protein